MPKPIFPSELKAKKERVRELALREINFLCDVLPIKSRSVRTDALTLYMKLYDLGFTRGRSRSCVVGSILYILACSYGLPIFLEDILFFTQENEQRIKKCIRKICHLLKLKLRLHPPQVGVIRYGYELGFSAQEVSRAINYARLAAEKKLLSGDIKLDIAVSLLLVKPEPQVLKKITEKFRVDEEKLKQLHLKVKSKLDKFLTSTC
ncbi:MAG: hypothetical protein QW507_03365 [Candidatus Nanoarchaeia archaeon]|nr:hypothetical protein [Candidatus Haiyanarchaeum thermophilum]MCW1302880.1 hypothetical protein [Candidatus Haiyanarchaeum thermophilum]MCW1303559.1 hypothetical protein [Candidatus Haiyanarchaeum thermophilum]MCW1306241.1 hypothetical protein [Candidatus Haiyanarchaeum thermophilum]MCW1307523.1 hypothetical protein [Candidatus Haiyanarchaeum thermophilum]